MITPTITTDPQALTMTVTAELDVPVEGVRGSCGPTRVSSSGGGPRRRSP